jgi:type III pantothenate kinase
MQILAIDAGNTRIKWGYSDGKNWLSRGDVVNSDIASLGSSWALLPEPRKIMVSNVAGKHIAEKIGALLSRWQTTLHWIAAKECQCGVKNNYRDPQQLGSDRWAALIAAWQINRRASVVVNLGTAMTIDILSDQGVFEAGVIVPGLRLMAQALAQKTLSLDTKLGNYSESPNNTADAIASGALHAICGAIERMVKSAERESVSNVDCILSGGDARVVSAHLNIAHRIIDALVLEGLVRIAEAGN